MTRPDIWIGTIEISWSDEKAPNVFKPAFTVVTTWAASPEEFREKCIRMDVRELRMEATRRCTC